MAPNARPPVFSIEETYEEISHYAAIAKVVDPLETIDVGNNQPRDDRLGGSIQRTTSTKRERILDHGVLLQLMRKSDAAGLQRLGANLSILATTIASLHWLNSGHVLPNNPAMRALLVVSLYLFYGFQLQCFAFAGQHEFLHRSAFKTKWINDVCLFVVSVVCFEMGAHEKVMHKQHHTFTNNIDRDPELTSTFSREQLENPAFRGLPFTKLAFFLGFLDVYSTFKSKVGRIIYSALGIPVDYSGTSWSLSEWKLDDETIRQLQRWALGQVACYLIIISMFGRSQESLKGLVFWWIAPVIVGYPAVNFFRNLEHANCEVSKVSNCLRNTRSVRSNILVRTLLWDTNFHSEHHSYPMVPFYNLHKLNTLLVDHVVHNEKHHFSTQNWAAIMPGGWIDQQAADAQRYKVE